MAPKTRVVGLKILKNKLSEYVKSAIDGDRVLITDRDQVVAELSSYRGRSSTGVEAGLAALIGEGLLQPALMRGRPLHHLAPVAKLGDLLISLDASRDDR